MLWLLAIYIVDNTERNKAVIKIADIKIAKGYRASGERPRHSLKNEIAYTYLFWRKYNLPCRHIFSQHLIFGYLTQKIWKHWTYAWEDADFEIYETTGVEYVNREMYD